MWSSRAENPRLGEPSFRAKDVVIFAKWDRPAYIPSRFPGSNLAAKTFRKQGGSSFWNCRLIFSSVTLQCE